MYLLSISSPRLPFLRPPALSPACFSVRAHTPQWGDESFIAAHNALSPFSGDREADRKTLYEQKQKLVENEEEGCANAARNQVH